MKTIPEIIADKRAQAQRLRSTGQMPTQTTADMSNLLLEEAKAIEDAFVKNNDDYNCALTEAREETIRLRKALEPIRACFVEFFYDDVVGKPVEQTDLYADEEGDLTVENRYGGTNTGSPIKKIVLECLNAVVKAKYLLGRNENEKR